jgi:hypothetical protein
VVKDTSYRYTQIMKEWEKLKKDPSKCPKLPPQAEKAKPGVAGKGEPEKPKEPARPPGK